MGVFAPPLPGIPRFHPKFLASLFDDEYRTTIGIAEGNLVARFMGKPPQPSVLFGPTRFEIQHISISQAATVFGRVMEEAHKITSQQVPLLSFIGLNTEHEWIKQAFNPSSRWLADNYIRKALHVSPDGAVAEAINLHFRLLLKDPNRNYSIQLQPRADADDGVFAAINDHREWNKGVPKSDEVVKLLEESTRDISNRVTPIILGGVADD